MARYPSPAEYTGSGQDPDVVTPQHGMRGINLNTDPDLTIDQDWRENSYPIDYGSDD